VDCELPGGATLRLWSRADDWVSNQVFWRGWMGYEPETSPVFFALARESAVTLDIGAYVGFFALLAGHANPAGRVVAFEPLTEAFERLEQNVQRNRLENVACVRAAVGGSTGTAAFFHVDSTPSGIPCSSSLSHEFMREAAGVRSSEVPVLRLDEFVDERRLGPVGLIKIDTETTEPDVLEGALSTLRRDRPAIVCEVLAGRQTGPRIEELLRPLGYRFYLLTDEGPRQRERIEGHSKWLNYLFSTRAVAGAVPAGSGRA
jgi:FkbM family methyltransferase